MQLPRELEELVKEFAQPRAATLRSNWREGSDLNKQVIIDHWWWDYLVDQMDMDDLLVGSKESWISWCKYRMIIGPPRPHTIREMRDFDDEYLILSGDFDRHVIPWRRTWPESRDCLRCKYPGVPDWAKKKYILMKKKLK